MTTAAVVTPPAAPAAAAAPAAPVAAPAPPAATTTPTPVTPQAAAPAAATGDPAPVVPATPAAPAEPAAPARVVPTEYTLTLQQNSALDASDVAEISAMAKTQQLTNDEAQAALVAYEESLREQSTRFRSELEADTELGGANLAHTQRDVLRALDALVPASTPEGVSLRQFLNKSGLGNQPHLVRLLARAGKAMGEDRPVLTNAPQGEQPKDMVELFYGKQ